MFSKKINISNLKLSEEKKALVIAEIGINHEGEFLRCIKMIQKAHNSGANLVKLQVADPASNYLNNTNSFKLFSKSMLSKEDIFNIYKFCKSKKIKIFSTFDKKNYDFFKKLNQACYKISSSLFYDYFFIKDILKLNKPVFISTGVSDLEDIDSLLNLLKKQKNKNIILLHSRSLYPSDFDSLNLSRISYLNSKYNILTGFSDHSLGIDASAASIHYGSKVIEKHFTLDKTKSGYDHKISLEPETFKKMIENIRKNELMVGIPNFKIKDCKDEFEKIKKISRQFLVTKDINKNSFIKRDDFKLVRAKSYKNFVQFNQMIKKILNSKIKKNIKSGEFLRLKDFKG